MGATTEVLFVDDGGGLAVDAAEGLAAAGAFDTLVARSPAAAREHLAGGSVDCLVIVPSAVDAATGEFLAVAGDLGRGVPSVLFADRGTVLSEQVPGTVEGVCHRDGGEGQYAFLARTVENAVRQGRTDRERDRLRRVVENVPVGLFLLDGTGKVTFTTGDAAGALGLTGSESASEAFAEWPALASASERAIAGESVTTTVEAGDASYDVWFRPLGDPTERVVGAVIDVTERSQRERTLELYRTVVEAAGDAVYALDPEGYITMVNQAHAELSGIPKEELLGSHVTEHMRDEDVRQGTEVIREILSTPEKERGRFEFRGEGLYPGEKERFFEDVVAVVEDEEGDFLGSVGVIRDITERKHRERELERQNERLDEFASVVAHDLRTPLSVARGLVEDAEVDHEDPRLADAVASLDRMETLIDDLLTLARKGETVEETEPVSTTDVLREAWPDPAGAELVVADPPSTVEADRSRLRELFENLFRNSVEHGSTGSRTGSDDGGGEPALTVEVGSLEDGRGFYVADDGPGIPPEERDTVFDHGYTTAEEGTGLGLAIVEGIAGAHDWTVTVTEAEGGGARFEFSGIDRPRIRNGADD